jgi:hypothetical protein
MRYTACEWTFASGAISASTRSTPRTAGTTHFAARLGESYTEPERVYDTCMRRGMSLVTISDHDTLEGALRIADRPNTDDAPKPDDQHESSHDESCNADALRQTFMF